MATKKPRRTAEIIATLAEIKWFIEGDTKYMSKYYKEMPRTQENLNQAWREYNKLFLELQEPQNR